MNLRRMPRSGGRRSLLAGGVALAVLVGGGAAWAASQAMAPGPRPDGTAATSYGWMVTPAGRQVPLGDKPFGSAMSPDGKTVLVSNDGQYRQSLSVIDTASGKVRQSLYYDSPEALFVGLAFSPDGRHAYASAGGNNKIRSYDVTPQGKLAEGASIPLPTTNPAGITVNHFPAGLTVSADGTKLWVANSLSDSASVIDLAARTVKVIAAGSNPYAVALAPDGNTAYVSDWGGSDLTVIDTTTGTPKGTITVGEHPSALKVNAARRELYVADTDSDQVSVVNLASRKLSRTIDLAPYKKAPVGSNPNALALSPAGDTLYVANAGASAVDVITLGGLAGTTDKIAGRIPTGWYPTGVEVARDGKSIFVANAKGLGAGPNPGGPNPYTDSTRRPSDEFASQYVGSMIKGTLSVIGTPDEATLGRYTRQVAANDHYVDLGNRAPAASSTVVPRRAGDPSPIKHVIYVIKENRTYDQVLGSLGKGNGDPSLNLFDDTSAPNIRALARKFVTLDNFYAASEVSADGWSWSTAGTANTYTQKTWEANYADRGGRNHPYQYEGETFATAPGRVKTMSYLWDSLSAAAVTYRNFGYWRTGFGPVKPTAPNLAANTDLTYPGYDLTITDQSRMDAYAKAFKQFEATGAMPTMQFVRLPSDHTRGTTPGAPTPKAMIADNDLAVGRLVDQVSHSKFWKDTAIFVVEDDAQAGPDHVDGHRTEALVVSPYTQSAKVDSTFYSTVSMLRTMELITGVPPLTQFDASAIPMLNAFTNKPNQAPFKALIPAQSLTETNSTSAPMAAQSSEMNFGDADLNNPNTLNSAIWQSVRGANSPLPLRRGQNPTTTLPTGNGH